MLAAARHDLHLALRRLQRDWKLSLLIVLTLALALGSTSAVYSVVDAVLLRALPYVEPARLVHVGHEHPERGVVYGAWSPQDYADFAAGDAWASSGAHFYMAGQSTVNLTGDGRPDQVESAHVSEHWFATLGTPPLLGRTLGPADMQPGADHVVVLSEGLWRSRLGADANAVGRTLHFNGGSYTVVGVMAGDFRYPAATVQAWFPWSLISDEMIPHQRDVRWLDVIARLRDGVTPAAAARAASELTARLAQDYPESNKNYGRAALEPLSDSVVGRDRRPLGLLLAAVGLVALIACLNVANVLLARTRQRSVELALKGALGASRARMLRQLLLEALLLAVAGSALGLALAQGAIGAFVHADTSYVARQADIALDARVLGFSAALALVTALLFGFAPAWRGSATAPALALRGANAVGDGRAATRSRSLLVLAQVALVTALLYVGSLMLESVWRLANVQPGLATSNVYSFTLKLSGTAYPAREARAAARARVLDALAAQPGVDAVAGAKTAALGQTGERYGFTLAARPDVVVAPDYGAIFVTPGYFATLGVPLVGGRDFAPTDDPAHPRVAIVNRALAAKYFGAANPIGQRLKLDDAEVEIVGLVGDVRHRDVAETARPALYTPLAQNDRISLSVFLRSTVPAAELGRRVRAAVAAIDPDLAVAGFAPLSSALAQQTAVPRLLGWLLGGFAAVAVLIAALGVFGVQAYRVSLRRRELALRLAIGAPPRALFAQVMLQGLTLGALGGLVGLPLAWAGGRALEALVYETSTRSVGLLAAVVAGAAALAALASLAPALRSMRTDPNRNLRAD